MPCSAGGAQGAQFGRCEQGWGVRESHWEVQGQQSCRNSPADSRGQVAGLGPWGSGLGLKSCANRHRSRISHESEEEKCVPVGSCTGRWKEKRGRGVDRERPVGKEAHGTPTLSVTVGRTACPGVKQQPAADTLP